MNKKLRVCWISAGVSSFIAGYIANKDKPVDKFIYIVIDDQHSDSNRFIKDCEKILGKEIEKLQSEEYKTVEDAIKAAGVIKMPRGFAPCTNWLKKRVRKQWEAEHADYELTYIWGFDCTERNRADRILETMAEFHHEFPLIEKNITKDEAHKISKSLGVKRPLMYDMGYSNNNCVGCVKGGMGYWNKIRIDFPEVFEKRAKLERELGVAILKDKNGPVFLDELDPKRGRMGKEIMEDCGIGCELLLDTPQ